MFSFIYLHCMKYTYLLLLMLVCNYVYSKNYYVSSKYGNTKFSGTGASKPKKSIQEAADITKPGDTVFVMNGTYTNECPACNVVNIIRSGKKDKYIVYTNYPNQHPIISFDGWAGLSVTNGASYIKIVGFEVTGTNASIELSKALVQPQSCANKKGKVDPKYNGNGIQVDGRNKKHSHHIVIAKNTVHDCPGGGIGVSQCDYVTVDENIVYANSLYSIFGTSGISLYQFWNSDRAKGYHNFITRNLCYNNRSLVPWFKLCKIYDGNGIIVDDFRSKQNGSKLGPYNARTLIANNVCWYNGGTGIHTFQSDHIDIVNNTAYCNSRSKDFNAGQILSGIGDDNKIVNNILVADSDAFINSNYQNTHLMYENNLHYNVTTPGKEKISVTSKSSFSGINPAFVMPANSLKANFRLKSNSPAINHGRENIYSITDFDGKRRAQGNLPDIGAYEY